MTELARQIAIAMPKNPPGLVTEGGGDLLPLTGGVPATVYVTVDQNDRISFSLADQPGNYTGIAWQCAGYALMITFVFDDPSSATRIVDLAPETPSFWFSDTYVAGCHRQQGCCVPSVPGTYRFHARLGNGMLVDPKIIVTPLPG